MLKESVIFIYHEILYGVYYGKWNKEKNTTWSDLYAETLKRETYRSKE